MPKARNTGDIGAKRDPLSDEEEETLRLAFERSLEDTRALDTEVVRDKIEEYMDEIMIAAEVANHELQGMFDGQSPESGNFGVDKIHPGYFGYDSWDDMPGLTGGDTFNWLDQETPSNLSGGTAGFDGPLTIGEPATHIILGFGSYDDDPVVSRLKERKNDNPYPALTTEDAFRNTDIRVKWLDTPRILKPEDTYAVRGYVSGEVGSSYEDAIYPIGLTFLEARYYRVLDPADMAGTDDANIVVE